MRWPGVIKPGTVINDICSLQDMHADVRRRGRRAGPRREAQEGYKSASKTFKVHLDGYNLLPFLKGEVTGVPAQGFLYWSDDGDLMALRVRNWKVASSWSSAPQASRSGRNRSQAAACRTLQPAQRPVRARPDSMSTTLDVRPRLPARARAGDGGEWL